MKVTIKKRYILCRGGEETVLPYSEVKDFVNGFAIVELNGKYGFIDETGKEVVPLKYTLVQNYFDKGFALVRRNGKTFFVDETGKETVPPKNYLDYLDDSDNYSDVILF